MPTYDVRLKQIDPLLAATVREIVSIDDDLGQQYERISTYLEQQGVQHTQPDLLLRYSRYELHNDGMYADVELAVPLRASLPSEELTTLYSQPIRVTPVRLITWQ